MQRLALVCLLGFSVASQAQVLSGETVSSALEKQQQQMQSDWGLSEAEVSRYPQALSRLAPFLDVENIGPLEVLGMSAETSQEKRALAKRHVRAMLAHQVRAIEWSLYVEEAAKAIRPGDVIAQLPMVEQSLAGESSRLQAQKKQYFSSRLSAGTHATSTEQTIARAAIDSRLVLFVEPDCVPCDQAFDQAKGRLDAGQLLGVDVVFAGMQRADKRVITQWAIQRGISAESVTKRRITLNFENAAWRTLRADRVVPVSVRAGES